MQLTFTPYKMRNMKFIVIESNVWYNKYEKRGRNIEFSKYQFIGKLNTEFLEIGFGKLATNELILTDERDEHIKKRHAQDYKLFHKCVYDVVNIPDVILRDSKNQNTVFYIKYIEETHLNIVIRLSLEIESNDKKNSIITSYQLGTKTLKRLKKNNKTLYSKE